MLNGAGRIIFELIKGEMDYVKDLENIEIVRIYEYLWVISY